MKIWYYSIYKEHLLMEICLLSVGKEWFSQTAILRISLDLLTIEIIPIGQVYGLVIKLESLEWRIIQWMSFTYAINLLLMVLHHLGLELRKILELLIFWESENIIHFQTLNYQNSCLFTQHMGLLSFMRETQQYSLTLIPKLFTHQDNQT